MLAKQEGDCESRCANVGQLWVGKGELLHCAYSPTFLRQLPRLVWLQQSPGLQCRCSSLPFPPISLAKSLSPAGRGRLPALALSIGFATKSAVGKNHPAPQQPMCSGIHRLLSCALGQPFFPERGSSSPSLNVRLLYPSTLHKNVHRLFFFAKKPPILSLSLVGAKPRGNSLSREWGRGSIDAPVRSNTSSQEAGGETGRRGIRHLVVMCFSYLRYSMKQDAQ